MKKNINNETLEIIIDDYNSVHFNITKLRKIDGIFQINGLFDTDDGNNWVISGALDENYDEVIPITLRKLEEEPTRDNIIDVIIFPNKKAVLKNINGNDYFISLRNLSFEIKNKRPVPNNYLLKQDYIGLIGMGNLFCVSNGGCFIYNGIDYVTLTPIVDRINILKDNNKEEIYETIIITNEIESEFNLAIIFHYKTDGTLLNDSFVYVKEPKPIRIDFDLPKNVVTRQEIIDFVIPIVDNAFSHIYGDSFIKNKPLN